MDRLAKVKDLSFSRCSTKRVATRLYIYNGDLLIPFQFEEAA